MEYAAQRARRSVSRLASIEAERPRDGRRVGSLLHYNSINGFEAALNAGSLVGQFASLLTENYRNRNLIRVNTVISRREEATVRGRRSTRAAPGVHRFSPRASFFPSPRVSRSRLVARVPMLRKTRRN